MTTDQLLNEIKTMVARKQMFSNKGISVDTLLLALRTTEAELMPHLHELQNRGDIIYQPAPSNISRRSQLLGTIHLTDVTAS